MSPHPGLAFHGTDDRMPAMGEALERAILAAAALLLVSCVKEGDVNVVYATSTVEVEVEEYVTWTGDDDTCVQLCTKLKFDKPGKPADDATTTIPFNQVRS